MLRAKVSSPASIRASISSRDTSFGGRNKGGWKALTIRCESGDWSSSTMAMGALWSVSGNPLAIE
jgi:hypothetical protein